MYIYTDCGSCSVVQGVRRWIGSQPNSSPKKTLRKVASRAELKNRPVLSDIDRHSTEVMATQLLEPAVSDTEEAEYHGLVVRFRTDLELIGASGI
jgi:hypothetical protein